MSKKKINSGALIDTRSDEAKLKDFKQNEVVASLASVDWREKPREQWRTFPIFNQDGSGSCVAQTTAKELGVMRWLKDGIYVHFSATDIYQRRSNKPQSGMNGNDSGEIVRKGGATLEVLVPSQNMSDEKMDALVIPPYKRSVGEVFKVPNYLYPTIGDIDSIASTIQQTGKAVMVWFFFKMPEWTERPSIKYPNLTVEDGERHSVTAVDFTLVNGVKCLIIEDSWGPNAGMGGQRIIDETFFKARNWYARYFMNFKFDTPTTPKPSHRFEIDLEFGQTSDEVKALQECLKYDGTFPLNADSTGYFGAVTKKAVSDFQIKYKITTADNPGLGRVGPMTREKLNQIFA